MAMSEGTNRSGRNPADVLLPTASMRCTVEGDGGSGGANYASPEAAGYSTLAARFTDIVSLFALLILSWTGMVCQGMSLLKKQSRCL